LLRTKSIVVVALAAILIMAGFGINRMSAAGLSVADLSLGGRKAPTVSCQSAGPVARAFKVLIVGESWADGGPFFPELQNQVSRRLGGRGVRACSLAFSGRNSRRLAAELSTTPEQIVYRPLSGVPDKVIIMTGVNDEIQPIGAAAYSTYTAQLAHRFADVPDVEVITPPRVNDIGFKAPNWPSRAKRSVLLCYYNGCSTAVNDGYRATLRREHPEIRTIDYDRFIRSYRGNEGKYEPDGIHLRTATSHEYGTFLGREMHLDVAR
jgi:hypothetical protein